VLTTDYYFFPFIRPTILVTVLRGDNRKPSTAIRFFHPGMTMRLPYSGCSEPADKLFRYGGLASRASGAGRFRLSNPSGCV